MVGLSQAATSIRTERVANRIRLTYARSNAFILTAIHRWLVEAPPPDRLTGVAQRFAAGLGTVVVCGLVGAGIGGVLSHGGGALGPVGVGIEMFFGALVGVATAAVLGPAWVIGRRLLKRKGLH